ncbi:DNA-binding response regulator [Massilia sp. B-10]|nr:DNA-binding response regulator [Massilia sp. B-10]
MVDDSAFEQRMLAELLTKHDHMVLAAYNGHQGYELAASARPDLILLDVRMPYVDGFATCRLLKANPMTRPPFPSSSSAAPMPRMKKCWVCRWARSTLSASPSRAPSWRPGSRCTSSWRGALEAAAPGHQQPAALDEVLVRAARQLIDADLAAVPTLDEIAGQVGTYHEKLSQVFRETMGCTVFAYIRDQRIARTRSAAARHRDRHPGHRPAGRLPECGQFRHRLPAERNGMPPSTYRKLYTSGARH